MLARLKISHHSHSGRLRPHEHTSYLPLAVLIVLVGVIMVMCTVPGLSEASPGPQAGSVGLSGTVPSKPPTVAATISTPSPGQHFSSSPITISGTCPAKTLVEIYKNDIFGGSTPCDDDGHFELKVDLFRGENRLVARVYDALNQAGPDSVAVTVYNDAVDTEAAGLTFSNFSDQQLLINTDAVFRGTFPGQVLNVPLTIIGGRPPYAVNIEWGDNKNKIIPRGDNQTFNAGHVYNKAGTYQISIQATDSQDRVAFLTVAAIVNGQPTPIANTSSTKGTSGKLLVLWPLYVSSATLVFSFWLGEQREKRLLRAHPL